MAVKKTPNRVIEGDDIEEQIAALPELMYLTRTNPDNPAIWETYNPKTGEIVDTGVFEGGGDRGLLAASRPVLALAASVLGAPYLSEFIAGQTGLTGSALAGATGGTIAGGSTALTGGSAEDIAKATLLGGGGAYLGSAAKDFINSMDVPVDFTNMTPEQIADATETNFINDLQRAGLTNSQINDFITNSGGVTTPVATPIATTPVAVSTPVTDGGTVAITGSAPVSLNSVLNTISAIPNAGTVQVAAPRTPEQVNQDVVNLVNSQIQSNVTTPTNVQTPEQVITGSTPTTQQVINAITAAIPTIPAVTSIPVTPPVPPEVQITAPKTPTTPIILPPVTPPVVPPVIPVKPPVTPPVKETDPLKVAQLALSAAGLLTAGTALSNTGTPTGFDIVPVPEEWKTPAKTGVAPFTPLTPIDFGNRNLLIGTQWEKFLDPNYGKVPEPVQYSQPSNMSYNDLMSILGSKQGYPASSSLSINDIISGIQNQYGQAPRSTMG